MRSRFADLFAGRRRGRAAGLVKVPQFLAMPICVTLIQPFVAQYGEVIAMKAVAVIGLVMFVTMLGRMLTSREPQAVPAE